MRTFSHSFRTEPNRIPPLREHHRESRQAGEEDCKAGGKSAASRSRSRSFRRPGTRCGRNLCHDHGPLQTNRHESNNYGDHQRSTPAPAGHFDDTSSARRITPRRKRNEEQNCKSAAGSQLTTGEDTPEHQSVSVKTTRELHILHKIQERRRYNTHSEADDAATQERNNNNKDEVQAGGWRGRGGGRRMAQT